MRMRFPRSEDFSDAAHKIRSKVVAVTHNNEKHVDDFASGYSTDVVGDANGSPGQNGATTSKKSAFGFGGSSSKPEPAANILGVDPVVKTFYESDRSRRDRPYTWCEYPPRQFSKKQALKQDRVAIKLFKIKDENRPVISGRFTMINYMLHIQKPTLIAALKPILKKQDLFLDPSEIAEFRHPFRPLYFCADEIIELQRSTKEQALNQQLTLLLHVMGDIFGNVKAATKQLQDAGLINYTNAWIYFPKDCMLYVPGKDTERIFKVVSTRYEYKPLQKLVIEAREIQFDGKSFAWTTVEFDLLPWLGNRPICDMRFYPLQFHPDADAVRTRVQKRGRKVLDYQGLSYCKYTGVAYLELEETVEKHNVDCRILVDVYGYRKHHSTLSREGGNEHDPKYARIQVIEEPHPLDHADDSSTTSSSSDDVETYPKVKQARTTRAEQVKEAREAAQKHMSYIKRLSVEDQEANKNIMLNREADLVFVSPMLRGYALQNKLWLQFYVDDVEPVVWNDEAYDHLVYPEEQKDLVLSFVENHQRTRSSGLEMDDVIRGKGQGLVLLLSGPPGTGKTLTAEAVADRTRRPLYYLQAEDLGISAAALGANLKKVFEMSTEWDAVILLDEADVFMAERNPHDIARNELVSIFLRELEYFRGIIFLTTNLYSTIDSAFRSRVNIHLIFKSLAPEHRLLLWRKFLERLPPMKHQPGAVTATHESTSESSEAKQQQELRIMRAMDSLNEDDLKELAQWDLNGREIKNAIKTVKSWCDAKDYEMNLNRLESGIRVTSPNTTKRGSVDNSLYD